MLHEIFVLLSSTCSIVLQFIELWKYFKNCKYLHIKKNRFWLHYNCLIAINNWIWPCFDRIAAGLKLKRLSASRHCLHLSTNTSFSFLTSSYNDDAVTHIRIRNARAREKEQNAIEIYWAWLCELCLQCATRRDRILIEGDVWSGRPRRMHIGHVA